MTVKVTIPPLNKPNDICQIMKECFHELLEVDGKPTIIPWKRLSISNVLDGQSELPKLITGLSKYCYRMYAPKEGTPATTYLQLFLGHDDEFDELRETLQPWLDSKLYGLYNNMLQAEDAKDIGWLLYSTREMDTGALADKIMDMIGVDIGLRWENIPTGTRKQENIVKALVVEAPARKKWQVQRALLKLYSGTIKPPRAYPNSIRLCFVKF